MSRRPPDDEPMPMFRCSVGACQNRVAKRDTACTETSGGQRSQPRQSTPERNAAYRAGICVDCLTEPHSAGRPRCEDCHAAMPVDLIEPKLQRRGT